AVNSIQANQTIQFDPLLFEALYRVINDESINPAFKTILLQLPSNDVLIDAMKVAKPDLLLQARQALVQEIASQFYEPFQQIYDENLTIGPYRYHPSDVAKRQLKNLVLYYLVSHHEDAHLLCETQYRNANNMTDQFGALIAVNHIDATVRLELLRSEERRVGKEGKQ